MDKSGRRRSGGRSSRVAARQASAADALITHIDRGIPYFDVLNEEALTLIEHNAETVLEEIGIDFKDAPEALALWRNAGATIEGERVRDRTVLAPAYGSPFVRDLDRGRRYATIEDFRNFVKLTYINQGLHHSGGTVCEPVDLPVNKRHFDMVYSHIKYSDKPFMGSVTHPERAQDTVDMAKIVFGDAFAVHLDILLGDGRLVELGPPAGE